MKSEADSKAVLKACTHFLCYHRPQSPKESLSFLAEQMTADEEADNYGTGELIEGFEKKIAALLGKEAAVFMPSGTMAQTLALRIWSDEAKNRRIGLHATSHLELHEHQAYHHLHGLEAVFLGERERGLSAADLHAVQERLSGVIVELFRELLNRAR